MYYIKVKDLEERTALIKYLKTEGITAVFRYVPLHTSTAGKSLESLSEKIFIRKRK